MIGVYISILDANPKTNRLALQAQCLLLRLRLLLPLTCSGRFSGG